VEIFIRDAEAFEFKREEARHAFPLAEDYDFLIAIGYDVVNDVDGFVSIGLEVGGLVENIGAVAGHTHLGDMEQEPIAIGLGNEVGGLPTMEYFGNGSFAVVVDFALLRGKRDVEDFVGTLRHL
jgi:hypothetical protein